MGGVCATYAHSILVGKLTDRDYLEDLGVYNNNNNNNNNNNIC
jgi:hypothetical protein